MLEEAEEEEIDDTHVYTQLEFANQELNTVHQRIQDVVQFHETEKRQLEAQLEKAKVEAGTFLTQKQTLEEQVKSLKTELIKAKISDEQQQNLLQELKAELSQKES